MRLLWTLAVTLVTASSWAAAPRDAPPKWTLLGGGEGEEVQVYFDPGSIVRGGSKAKMWTLRDFPSSRTPSSGRPYLSARVRREYDCDQPRARTLYIAR